MLLKDIEIFARNLLVEHKLDDWRIEWFEVKRAYGQCCYSRKVIRVNRLWVARAETKVEDIHDTVKHEVAHALTPGAGHGWKWKIKAMQLGAKPKSCGDHGTIVEGKYQAKCECGKIYHRHRRPVEGKYRCPICRRPLVFTNPDGTITVLAPKRVRKSYVRYDFGGLKFDLPKVM